MPKKRVKKLPFSQTRHISISPKKREDKESKPIFSLKYMKYGHKNCLSKLEKEDRARIIDKLLHLSQYPWKKINILPKEGHGFNMMPRKELKLGSCEILTADVDDIMVFRYSDSGRIAGHKIDEVYHILACEAKVKLYRK